MKTNIKSPSESLISFISVILAAIALFAMLILLTGCAYTTQNIRTETKDKNGVVEVKFTKNRAMAWGDARQTIEKLQLSNGKTQSVGLSGIDESASTTNVAGNIAALTQLLNALKTP